MGRPKSSDRREKRINMSLTDREYAHLVELADICNRPVAELARALALGRADDVARRSSVDQRELRLVRHQLSAIGNNFNQTARALHRSGLTPDQAPDLAKAYITLREELRAAGDALEALS